MEYFVTGATGFVGTRLVRGLVDAGEEVVALVRPTSDTSDLPASTTLAEGDVTDKRSMRDAMDGVDGVFHLAAWYKVGVDEVELAERVNVEGTRNVLELMDELDVPRGVYTSTVAVFSDTGGVRVDESYRHDGPHLSTYDRTKWEAHYEVARPLMDAGLPLIVAMPGVVYGPGDEGPLVELWTRYLNGDLPVVPGRAGVCFEHVEDTVRSLRLAMDRGMPGEEYIVAGWPYTLAEAFEVAAGLTGIDAPRTIPPGVVRGLASLAGAIESVVDLPRQYRAETLRAIAGVTYWGDNAKAARELGIEHRPFEEGLRGYLAGMRRRPDVGG